MKIYYNRKSLRLKDYDYSQNGMYYITICTKSRENILSNIETDSDYCRGRVPPLPSNNISKPNYNQSNNQNNESLNDLHNIKIIQKHTELGNMIETTLKNINQIDNVEIYNHVIMPDHIHFIIELNDEHKMNFQGRGGTLPLHAIIGRFKSFTTKQYNLMNGTIGIKLWQRNYFEHIIRNEKEYYEICEYINNNPINYVRKHYLMEL